MRINKDVLFAGGAALLLFGFSFVVSPFYTGGDQFFYRAVYELLGNSSANVFEDFETYREQTASSEPIYFIVAKMLSPFFAKDLVMSVFNGLLTYLIVEWLLRRRVCWPVVVVLLTNFYLFVIFFAAERLKFSMLLLLAANLFASKRYLFGAFSVLAHVQGVFLIASAAAAKIPRSFGGVLRGRLSSLSKGKIAVACIATILLFFLADHIVQKYDSYSDGENGLAAIFRPAVFLLMTFFYARRRYAEAFFVHMPIIIGAFLIGPNRLVMFSYCIFLYYALSVRRGLNFGVLVTSLYFSVQGVVFLKNIIYFGNGFFGVSGA